MPHDSIIQNFRKCKLTDSDRKQVSGCLGKRDAKTAERDDKGIQGTF